jgi:AcrR family transcriptional regulator
MATQRTDSERPLRADARRNRARILDAARQACAEYGASTQMDDVARRAGVGIGTVYRHFPTKETLLEALVDEKFHTFATHAREAREVADPWEAFAGLLRRNAELMAADAGLRDAIGSQPLDYAGAAFAELMAVGDELLRRAQDAGAVRADVTIEDIPMLMSSLCVSMANPRFDWRRHLDLVLDGLRARP